MVLARFLPRDEQFFTFFTEAARNASETAKVLAEVVELGPEVGRRVRRLHDLEHHGDEITHQIFSALNSTFVTPLDRDDIHALASEIDNFVDMIEEVGHRMVLYRMGETNDRARRFAQIIVEQGDVLARAIPVLEFMGKQGQELRNCVLELHRLENEADDALNEALASLYDGVTEVPQMINAIRWGELYGLLEDATDRGEDVANTLEGMLLKYA